MPRMSTVVRVPVADTRRVARAARLVSGVIVLAPWSGTTLGARRVSVGRSRSGGGSRRERRGRMTEWPYVSVVDAMAFAMMMAPYVVVPRLESHLSGR